MTTDVRAVMLDVGRKRFGADWIVRLLESMGELGLNTLQLHLSDAVGLGVELPGFERLAAPGALTADDVALIRARADACGVRLIPELDTPSHATPLLVGREEFRLKDRSGAVEADKIDLSNRAARRYVAELWDAVIGLFEPDVVHLGGDEFLAAPWEDDEARRPDRYPVLLDWARAEAGPGATAEDAYALYVTELVDHVRRRGCSSVWLWNDHVVPAAASACGGSGGHSEPRPGASDTGRRKKPLAGARPLVAVPQDVVVDVWVRWREWTPSVLDYLASGYDVVNSNGDLLYFVLSSDGVPQLTGSKSAEDIAATFRPTRFMGLAGQRTWIDVAADDPRVLGAKLSVWCDAPDALTPDETWTRLRTWLTPFAASFR